MTTMTMENAEIYEMIMELPVEKSKRVVDYVRRLYAKERLEPNQETIEAMQELRAGLGVCYDDVDAMLADLWDAQIERDAAAGKLDWLAERALRAVSRAI